MTFLSKFGWSRHETTLHHQTQVWICHLDEVPPFGFSRSCAFCDWELPPGLPPDPFMLFHENDEHRFRYCKDQGKCFGRKDELVQHLRGFHRYSRRELPSVETWTKTVEQPDMVWRCGICSLTFTEWSVRLNHVGKHWDEGQTMRDWNAQPQKDETADGTKAGDELRAARDEHNQSPRIDGSRILPVALQRNPTTSVSQSTDIALQHPTSFSAGPSHLTAAAIYAPVATSGSVPFQSQPEGVLSGIWGKIKSVAHGIGS
jgi:hypothetical protein